MQRVYSRTLDDAVRAEQKLVLWDGGETGPFAAQVQALSHVRNVVFRALRKTDAPPLDGDKIYLQRRVFTKVRRSDDGR